jgi:hypothetical protein
MLRPYWWPLYGGFRKWWCPKSSKIRPWFGIETSMVTWDPSVWDTPNIHVVNPMSYTYDLYHPWKWWFGVWFMKWVFPILIWSWEMRCPSDLADVGSFSSKACQFCGSWIPFFYAKARLGPEQIWALQGDVWAMLVVGRDYRKLDFYISIL